MKKILILSIIALSLVGCRPYRVNYQPKPSDVPSNFTFINDEGNGYYKYHSPDGFFLVSTQVQGQAQLFASNRFIDIVYIGK